VSFESLHPLRLPFKNTNPPRLLGIIHYLFPLLYHTHIRHAQADKTPSTISILQQSSESNSQYTCKGGCTTDSDGGSSTGVGRSGWAGIGAAWGGAISWGATAGGVARAGAWVVVVASAWSGAIGWSASWETVTAEVDWRGGGEGLVGLEGAGLVGGWSVGGSHVSI
jgi:hypothetical protein